MRFDPAKWPNAVRVRDLIAEGTPLEVHCNRCAWSRTFDPAELPLDPDSFVPALAGRFPCTRSARERPRPAALFAGVVSCGRPWPVRLSERSPRRQRRRGSRQNPGPGEDTLPEGWLRKASVTPSLPLRSGLARQSKEMARDSKTCRRLRVYGCAAPGRAGRPAGSSVHAPRTEQHGPSWGACVAVVGEPPGDMFALPNGRDRSTDSS